MGKITRGAGATVDGAPADVDGRPVLLRGRYILVRDGAIDFLDGSSLTAAATIEVDDDGNVSLPGGTVTDLTATGDVSLGGASTSIGFYGATPDTKPTVTGVQTDGTALASLLSALDGLGLITDSSTAT